jgi:hypothetical protein
LFDEREISGCSWFGRAENLTALFAEALAGGIGRTTPSAEQHRRIRRGWNDNNRGYLTGAIFRYGILRRRLTLSNPRSFFSGSWLGCADGMTTLFTEALAWQISRTAFYAGSRFRLR